jgi:two-component system, NarL family, sensor histidine kinase DegS
MTTPDTSPSPGGEFAARLQADLAALDRELAEIDMLIGQARGEATRHEQRRAQATERIDAPGRKADPRELADAYAQLVTLTRRAVLMEAQVDVLEGKRRALARHRAAVAEIVETLQGGGADLASIRVPGRGDAAAEGAPAPGMSRLVLSAQEDLRREIARAMHDGPAQSLTNIVLQAEIVDRLLDRNPDQAKGELRLLVSMVQQTLEATKTFIFDVRPMVLDDLGLVPTLRRAARDRGRRAHVPVEFESMGQDRRLPMEVETSVFRLLDEALAAYLSLGPERVTLRLDWGDSLEARVAAQRTVPPSGDEPLPDVPSGKDVPDAIKQMIQDRHDARQAAAEAAVAAAVVSLPAVTRRDAVERASSIGAIVEFLEGGGETRLLVPISTAGADAGAEAGAVAGARVAGGDGGAG